MPFVTETSKYYSKAYSQFGASMGRRNIRVPNENELCNLHMVPLDSGGYDPGGAYWGTSDFNRGVFPLYRLQYSEGERFIRAKNRFQAFLGLIEEMGVDFRVRAS